MIRQDTWRRTRLAEIAARVRAELSGAGMDLHGSASHIVSLEGGDERQTMALRDALEQRGVFGSVFCPPATPRTGPWSGSPFTPP